MQNEFEKQVQQKMEELKLVPSEPVWQKVEMQIRKKKDRRRLIFWIPLTALLLGSGLWLGIDQYSNHTAYNKSNSDKLNHQTQKQNPVVQSEQSIVQSEQSNREEIISVSPERNLKKRLPVEPAKRRSSITVIAKEDVRFNAPSSRKKLIGMTKMQEENAVAEPHKQPSTKNEETIFSETQPIVPEKQTIVPEKLIEPVRENQQTNSKTTDSGITSVYANEKTDSLIEIEKRAEITVVKIDSLKKDSTFVKKPSIKKYADFKWKFAFAVSGGISGTGRLEVFNGFLSENKSMDYSSVPNPGGAQNGGTLYLPASNIQEGFSFTVRAGVKKQLTGRMAFFSGLQYNYYSNSILVGNPVLASATFGNYLVTQYFSNNRNVFGSTTWKHYRNDYHFVSVPLVMEWQLLKKRPLNLSTGLSLQYLIQTNGLIFDYNKQAYFHNENALNRIQLFSDLGLNYSFSINKSLMAIGPQLQYGISRLEKDNSSNHLYMYGLKAQLQLK
jgi:hypothetical protein